MGRICTARLLLTMTLLVGAICCTDCSRSRSESAEYLLTYWSSTNPHEIELSEELVAEWNELHPRMKVKLQPLPEGRSGEEVLIIAAAGGTAPDVCSNVPPIVVPLLAQAAALVPVDNFTDGRSYLAERIPAELLNTFVSSDGRLYQIPWKGNPIMVQYNTGILKEVGFEQLPATWSEWNHLAALVSGDTDGDGRDDRWMADLNIIAEWRQRLFDFYPFFIAASHGETLLRNNRDINFNTTITRDIFEFYGVGFRNGWYANSIWIGDQYLQGHMAAHITGPWNISHTERFKPPGFQYDFGPIPVPDGFTGDHYTFGDPKSIGIFSTSEHPAEAWEFVKFLISREADGKLLEICGQLPLRKELLCDTLYAEYFSKNPHMRKFAELVPFTRGFDQSPALQEVFDAINEQFDAACIQNRRTADEALKRAVKRSENVLKARGN
ncbi:MAG: extracellular solute-binding protein [Candidatus Neomarinimicrobiota bacterium]